MGIHLMDKESVVHTDNGIVCKDEQNYIMCPKRGRTVDDRVKQNRKIHKGEYEFSFICEQHLERCHTDLP